MKDCLCWLPTKYRNHLFYTLAYSSASLCLNNTSDGELPFVQIYLSGRYSLYQARIGSWNSHGRSKPSSSFFFFKLSLSSMLPILINRTPDQPLRNQPHTSFSFSFSSLPNPGESVFLTSPLRSGASLFPSNFIISFLDHLQ